MKCRIFFAVLLVVAALLAGRYMRAAEKAVNTATGTNRDETRQAQRLEPGARVEVRGINGAVEVRTAETDTAEVRVVRTAASAADLEYGKVRVEMSPSGVFVEGERGGGFWRWVQGGGGVRQQVTLVLPRRVSLVAESVNGNVEVGEVDGPVTVAHVNGRVGVAQSAGRFEVRRVNGNVRVGVARLGHEGAEVSRVNGQVEIRLRELVNADIEARRHNGRLTLDVPNVTMQQREDRKESRARLGSGGAFIQITRVNGNVHFGSDAPAAAPVRLGLVPHADALPPPAPPMPPAAP
jgi:DUF4097 and DUF4098 domain-containing protein YvlB